MPSITFQLSFRFLELFEELGKCNVDMSPWFTLLPSFPYFTFCCNVRNVQISCQFDSVVITNKDITTGRRIYFDMTEFVRCIRFMGENAVIDLDVSFDDLVTISCNQVIPNQYLTAKMTLSKVNTNYLKIAQLSDPYFTAYINTHDLIRVCARTGVISTSIYGDKFGLSVSTKYDNDVTITKLFNTMEKTEDGSTIGTKTILHGPNSIMLDVKSNILSDMHRLVTMCEYSKLDLCDAQLSFRGDVPQVGSLQILIIM